MTTEIEIRNVSANKALIVVNVWERQGARDEGKNVERHDLEYKDSVTVRIWGWQRGVTILEADTTDIPESETLGPPTDKLMPNDRLEQFAPIDDDPVF